MSSDDVKGLLRSRKVRKFLDFCNLYKPDQGPCFATLGLYQDTIYPNIELRAYMHGTCYLASNFLKGLSGLSQVG